jgi:nucleoside-diphosphate-sugar epimerase
MKVLFIGGTGVISTAATSLAAARGIDLHVLNRGKRAVDLPRGVVEMRADIHDPASLHRALEGHVWDAVVNWIAFTPGDVERDVALFRGKTRQYLFISSASVYQKPATHHVITESTPLVNPHWEYSRQKIASEERLLRALREEGFPGVIVRPSLTYGDTLIPLVVNSWGKPYTVVNRMKRRKPVIVPGDGTSLWTITHNSDFAKGLVGLLGHEQSTGHAFHITSDEVLTWNQFYQITAAAAGVEAHLVHVASDFLVAWDPGEEGSLLGDKSISAVFDNSKIKRFVPDFVATTPFAQGIRRTLEWFEADPGRCVVDAEADGRWDRLIEAYTQGLEQAKLTRG